VVAHSPALLVDGACSAVPGRVQLLTASDGYSSRLMPSMKVRYAVSLLNSALVYFAELLVPPLLVVLAVVVDLRSRRGFGLALLAPMMVGYCLWRIIPIEQGLLQPAESGRPLYLIGLLLSFLQCGYLTLLLWIGTVVEVSMPRQTRWLVVMVAEAVLVVLAVVAVALLQLETPLFTFMGGAAATFLLLLPMVTALAYGVVRIARPTLRPEPEAAPDALTLATPGTVPQQPSRMPPQPAAQYRGSVIAVRILSPIMFLSVSFVLAAVLFSLIRAPWYTYPAGTSQDVIGTANIARVFFSIFLGLPASVIAIVTGHATLLIRRRIPHRPERKEPGRMVLTVLLVASLVTAYLAVALQIFDLVMIFNAPYS
jgi:hypothetical protein